MLSRTLPTLAALTLLSISSHAQRFRCGTPEPSMTGTDPGLSIGDCGYATNSPQPEYEPSCYYDIQVVFHVIQNTSGAGFLSAQKIQDQIDILNEDFQALPGTPGAPGTDSRVRFHLATTDPGGNATTGITYSMNNTWFQDNGSYWNSLAWDTNRYLNIYTNAVPCCYGYVSDFPSNGVAGDTDDRVVVWWEAVGRQATQGWPLNMGRTATHEVGHYLGLYHTFCGGCGSASACYSTGDLICDTNREQNPTYGCPSSKNSCSSPDPIHNYMDYTDDPCLWEFTPEQVNRIRCTLTYWRPDLYQVCVPETGFNYCQSTANSSGASASISSSGDFSISTNNLVLTATGAAVNKVGLFYYGGNQVEVPFGDGFRCVGGQIFRLSPLVITDLLGSAQRALDFTTRPLGSGSGMVSAGSSAYFQFWFRDPSGPGGSGFNLSDGLCVTFAP